MQEKKEKGITVMGDSTLTKYRLFSNIMKSDPTIASRQTGLLKNTVGINCSHLCSKGFRDFVAVLSHVTSFSCDAC